MPGAGALGVAILTESVAKVAYAVKGLAACTSQVMCACWYPVYSKRHTESAACNASWPPHRRERPPTFNCSSSCDALASALSARVRNADSSASSSGTKFACKEAWNNRLEPTSQCGRHSSCHRRRLHLRAAT